MAERADARPVVWEYDTSSELPDWATGGAGAVFLPFAEGVGDAVERAHAADPNGVADIRIGGDRCEVDFARMLMRNTRTHDTHEVRRWTSAPEAVAAGGEESGGGDGLGHSPSRAKRQRRALVEIPATHRFNAGAAVDWEAVTGWRRVTPPAFDPAEVDLMGDELGDGVEEPVVELKSFISRALDTKPECCSCGFRFPAPGPQPSGTMTLARVADKCAGFEHCGGSIAIEYRFGGGVQTDRMPEPGAPYSGTARRAYLPDNAALGERAAALLVRAFMLGQTFRIGTSVTTGVTNTTVWAGIHHKTRLRGGAEQHGWPDPTFMDRLVSECAACGIMEEDVASGVQRRANGGAAAAAAGAGDADEGLGGGAPADGEEAGAAKALEAPPPPWAP